MVAHQIDARRRMRHAAQGFRALCRVSVQ